MSLQPGDLAPELNRSFLDSEGRVYTLADRLSAGPLVLAIYKSSCPACKAMMPLLNRLVDRYGADGLQIVGVAQDSANVTRSFIRRSGGLAYPVLIEGDEYPLSRAFGISATPALVLIRQDGTIAFASMGFDRDYVDDLARASAAELGTSYQPVIDAQTDEAIPLTIPGCPSKHLL